MDAIVSINEIFPGLACIGYLDLNGGANKWELDVVEVGPHSSHLGAKAADLDGEGVPEIVSVSWVQSCCVHRWIRSAPFQ